MLSHLRLVRYVITVIKFVTIVGGKVFSFNCTTCEWPQTHKLVINTTKPYSYAGKYYLPVGRPKHIGKYQSQI